MARRPIRPGLIRPNGRIDRLRLTEELRHERDRVHEFTGPNGMEITVAPVAGSPLVRVRIIGVRTD